MNRLYLGVAQQLVEALLTSGTTVLHAAERRAIEMPRGSVDPHVTRPDRASRAESSPDVVGPYGGRQPVLRRIRERECILFVPPAEDRQDWPEDFLPRNAHRCIDIGEYSRFEPIASLELSRRGALPASEQ